MTTETNYRFILKNEFEKRCSRNPNYSLRAFARDLTLSPSRLSEAMNSKRGISKKAAIKICEKLGFNEIETTLFTTLVESEHSRSPRLRIEAEKKLTHLNKKPLYKTLQMDVFRLISDWYHYAILELTEIEAFRNDVNWISNKLNISKIEAELAIKRMKRLGLIVEENSSLKPSENFTASPSGVPSEYIKKFHEQVLDKAKKALYLQDLEERDFSSLSFSIDTAKLSEAKRLLKKFRREFAELMTSSGKKDSVYNLSIQFFRLDNKERG